MSNKQQQGKRVKVKKPVHPEVRSLLARIVDYCEQNNCTRTAFGVNAVGDGNLIRSLERGRMPMFSTIDRIRAYIRDQQKKHR